jgi:hypothetical protein
MKKQKDAEKKRDDLAYQLETLIQDFTNKTNYTVERIEVEYRDPAEPRPRVSSVRISVRLGVLHPEIRKRADPQ